MRELQTSDLFAFVRLIEKSGIKDELKAKALEIKSIADINAESLGYDIILMVLEKAAEPKTEKEVYSFFAPIFEMKEEEIKKMDAIEFLETVTKVASLERWRDFFSLVAKLQK